MAIELPALPWAKDALAPHISEETIDYHYGKHHRTYVTKLNAAIEGTPAAESSLEDIVRTAEGGVFNNAAQVLNHSFYWNCMKPGGGGEPTGELARAIAESFGSFDKFKEEFSNAAATQFGSGWAWLVRDGDGGLKVTQTPNADTPLRHGQTPLLTIDVWEHAYYIDFRNDRPGYIETFDFAAENLAKA
jgi:Fe-Mn family superoxide dismutase